MIKSCVIIFCSLICFATYAQTDTPKCFRLPANLPEVSGLFIQNPDSFWWHNDSGALPRLFCTNARGTLIDSLVIPRLKNQDWEDITSDNKGNIYIGDFGNNNNQRKDLKIYIYNQALQALDSILFNYPDQISWPPEKNADWSFDMEGFFWKEGFLHLFSKDHYLYGNGKCKHYKLNDQPGKQVAKLYEQMQFPKGRIVTAASISPDGETVVLLTYTFKKLLGIIPHVAVTLFYFKDFPEDRFFEGQRFKKKAPYFLIGAQYEAIDFLNNREVYLATEKVWRINQKAKRTQLKKKHFKKPAKD